jgi:WD40 repeat protein
VKAVQFGRDPNDLIVISRSLDRWDARSGLKINNPDYDVWSSAIREDGYWILPEINGVTSQLKLLSETGELITTIPTGTLANVATTNGVLLAAYVDDVGIPVWDVRTGKAICGLSDPDGPLKLLTSSIYLLKTGGKLIAGGMALRDWDARTCAPAQSWRDNKGIVDFIVSPDETRLLAYDQYNGHGKSWVDLRLFDAQSLAPLNLLGQHASDVATTAFSPDSRLVFVGFKDGYGALFDVASGRQLFDLNDAASHVTTATFSPDSGRLLLGAVDASVRVLDARSGKLILSLR